MVQNLLIEAGIETKILNEFAQGGTGEIPFTQTYPEVWLINEEDLNPARKIITSFEQRPGNVGTLACKNCDEINPDTFEVCWRCGASLPTPDHD